MTKSKLTALVEGLQPQVDQLADVLSLELSEERDYVQVLVDAHRKMAVLSEEVAGESVSYDEDQIYEQLLEHTGELTEAMQAFLAGKKRPAKTGKQQTQSHAAHQRRPALRGALGKPADESPERAMLLRKLVSAANRCRERRQEMSLLVVEPNVSDIHADPEGEVAVQLARRALADACEALDPEKVILLPMANHGAAAIISNCERQSALSLTRAAIAQVAKHAAFSADEESDTATTLSVGVATVSVVPKNFDPVRVVESAMRCVSAARACGISAVKSIEV
jgi:hypothetical protein